MEQTGAKTEMAQTFIVLSALVGHLISNIGRQERRPVLVSVITEQREREIDMRGSSIGKISLYNRPKERDRDKASHSNNASSSVAPPSPSLSLSLSIQPKGIAHLFCVF